MTTTTSLTAQIRRLCVSTDALIANGSRLTDQQEERDEGERAAQKQLAMIDDVTSRAVVLHEVRMHAFEDVTRLNTL